MGTYAYTHRHKYMQTNREFSLAFISVVFSDHYNNSNINSKTINDLLLNY